MTGLRDDGYHLIDAEMVSLSLVDRLEIEPTDGSAPNRIEVVAAADTDTDPIPLDDDNLVAKALRLAGRSANVRLHKAIPAGAGLGGGSSDAAAVLRWAGYTDLEGAASIGADVAFCLVGGRARVTGIGEIVEPLEPVARQFTLLTPPIHCSTPAVYRAWDDLGGPIGDHGNDLEPAALVVAPELADFRDRLAEISGQRPRLAGSGSTWFVEGNYEGPDLTVVHTL